MNKQINLIFILYIYIWYLKLKSFSHFLMVLIVWVQEWLKSEQGDAPFVQGGEGGGGPNQKEDSLQTKQRRK